MSDEKDLTPLSEEELAAESGTALPDKEVASILDLNADLDLAIGASAPIDLAVAANANVAAPIDAAASANVLSAGSESQALADQGTIINQGIVGDATAESTQDSTIGQGSLDEGATHAETNTGSEPAEGSAGLPEGTPDVGGTLPTDESTIGDALDGDLLKVNVDLAADADIAAPINGAVGANANVAAPINAAVAANIGSVDSDAIAVSQQDAIINQTIEGNAGASANQQSDLTQ